MSFTPGPWEVENFGSPRVLATDAKGSFPVCDIRGWGHLTGKGHGALGLPEATAIQIQDANARLIAAAPDLLNELGRLYRAYVNLLEIGRDRIISLGGDCDPVNQMVAGDPALVAARAALSKAEGHIGQELAPGDSAQ